MMTINLEDGTTITVDLTDPNNQLLKNRLTSGKHDTRALSEYAHQIATSGVYLTDGTNLTFISPEFIASVIVPLALEI